MLYLAFDPVTEREVALKILRVDSDDLRERFLSEARLAARLQHPNIVTIYDVGAYEDQPFIAMEFIAGETLGQLVHRRAPLALSRRIALMEQVCVGLAYAHRHGIVHRDVKPANLMISRDSGVLKVLDFGVAGRVDADPGLQGQMLMGTPNYMSPEQVVGQASDHRSDIFSVGLVLYELLTLLAGLQWRVAAVDSLEGAERVAPAARLPRAGDRSLAAGHRGPRAPEVGRSPLPRPGGDAVGPLARRPAPPCRRDVARPGRPGHRRRPRSRPCGPCARPPARRRARQPHRPGARVDAAPRTHVGAEPGLSPELQPETGTGTSPARRPEAAPAARLKPDVADALAAAERDAYEGRFAAAIRRLEALGPHPEVDAALLHYRQTVAARDAARAQGASRVITDVIRAHVGGVRAAISAGRWREAQELLRTLEGSVPVPDDAGGPHDQPAHPTPDEARPVDGVAAPEPRPMRRDDEVAHYLSRARRRLEAGDVTAAQSLLDAALDMTRTP